MALDSNRKTITFDEVYGSWTSFHAYTPEWMERLGTNFYTFKDGELYLHDNSEVRTNFYGVTYGCDITYSSNESPSETKLFKAVSLETNSDTWYATIESELESGEIGDQNSYKFQDKEGVRYAYIRRLASDTLDFNKLSILGLGPLTIDPTATQFTFSENIPNQVSFNGADGVGGDTLYYVNPAGTASVLGVVNSYLGGTITLGGLVGSGAQAGDFCFIAKNPQTESYGVRGYHAKIKLTNTSTSFAELFAANSEVFKSNM
tara:strand:+ start:624 stop:1406 length:783 start_codon:yes stop_codon:yes gene_type:complete